PSGNRRFNPIDVVIERATKSVFDDLTESEIDQIWAEAMVMYKKGEPLFLSEDAKIIAEHEQREHSENDERSGIIENYLDRLLPVDCDSLDLNERCAFLDHPLAANGTVERDYVCDAEIWCECLGKNREDTDRYKTREINDILRSVENWEQRKSTRSF